MNESNSEFSYLIKPRSLTLGDDDHLTEAGNIAASSSSQYRDGLTWSMDDAGAVRQYQKEQWLMNYQEAAIYLEEGKNNEKFDTHPKNQSALPAYIIAHHPFFHVIDLLAALLLLSLAIIERPAVAGINVPIEIHASLEIFGIFVLAIDLLFKARWQGVKTFFTHKRSLFKCIVLLVMIIEATVVIARQTSHFRVTRALRPLFLLDTYYCHGIRRFWRQLMMSLPPILELLLLLIFVMVIFSILGFYLFSSNPYDEFFVTLWRSFISLFILLTTANYPDVMMPSYSQSPLSATFFIVYIVIELYFFMNIFLAVVYSTFTELEKTKVKKLLLHRRLACQHAFRLLVSKKYPGAVSIRHFCGMMQYYRPRMKKEQIYLIFKALNTKKTGVLDLDEFYNIYSVCGLSWKEESRSHLWFRNMPKPFTVILAAIHRLVTIKWFDYFIYLVILGNFIVILCEAIAASLARSPGVDIHDISTNALKVTWYSVVFTAIYILEILLKVLGLGPRKYLTNGWNLFDLCVTLVTLFGDIFKDEFFIFIILRPIRLIRIFKARKRYRDVFGTLFILADRLWSVVVTLILLYYLYAIIGMECFSEYDMTNCCLNNTSIAPYYANGTGYYMLNNFRDIFKSGVTLFELTVVNNWFIIMEGYAYVATEWSRIYFMTFYIVTMVVMTVVVAFILEAFMFKIQYRRMMHINNSTDYLVHKLSLSLAEVHMINNEHMLCWTGEVIRMQTTNLPSEIEFIGKKKRGKMELSLQMYEDDLKEWIEACQPPEATLSPPDILSHNTNGQIAAVCHADDSTNNQADVPFYIHENIDDEINLETQNAII